MPRKLPPFVECWRDRHGKRRVYFRRDRGRRIALPTTIGSEEFYAAYQAALSGQLAWPIGTKQRLAFALMLYTGQRRSDVHRMTWIDVSEGTIRVVQQKTGRKLTIPLHRDLLAVLAVANRDHVTIINAEYGKPFTVDGFSQWIRDAITAAGLPLETQPHGLRKAAGRRLAEAGCTAHEIMAVLGHKTLSEAERYTRQADQARLAIKAMTKLEGRTANTNAQTASNGLGDAPKTEEKSK
jgi:integrase